MYTSTMSELFMFAFSFVSLSISEHSDNDDDEVDLASHYFLDSSRYIAHL